MDLANEQENDFNKKGKGCEASMFSWVPWRVMILGGESDGCWVMGGICKGG